MINETLQNIIYFFRRSTFTRQLLEDKSNECMSYLEEKKIMKTDKSKEELIHIFISNIEKEYGTIKK